MNSAYTPRTGFGIAMAILATLIWSGNFIVARGVANEIPPATMAFFRWFTAALILLPFIAKRFKKEWPYIKQSGSFLFWSSLTGIAIFNTFVYIAGHYTSAINLALIGTTTSPIISILLARFFLKEKVTFLRFAGLTICIAGILLLLSKGSWDTLLHIRFGTGDWWLLAAALSFAVYNTMAKKKPSGISGAVFLFLIFTIGTILLFPFYLWEHTSRQAVQWNLHLFLVILYLGIGASVVSFLCWNLAIAHIGAGRTALFGNLIPVFSALEAVLLLNEKINSLHLMSGLLVVIGLILANLTFLRTK